MSNRSRNSNMTRITREFQKLTQSIDSDDGPEGIHKVELVNGEIKRWNVYIKMRDRRDLHKDLKRVNHGYIILRVRFDDEYPLKPPKVVVHSPILKGKFIMRGGGICIDTLSDKYWSPVMSMESVIVTVRSVIKEMDELSVEGSGKYDEQEAISAWERAMNKHGWNHDQ